MYRQDLIWKQLAAQLHVIVVQLFALGASSHCKRDMGALSWLNAKTFERVPTPFFGRLVRCSAHGHSFVRLRYMQTLCCLISLLHFAFLHTFVSWLHPLHSCISQTPTQKTPSQKTHQPLIKPTMHSWSAVTST